MVKWKVSWLQVNATSSQLCRLACVFVCEWEAYCNFLWIKKCHKYLYHLKQLTAGNFNFFLSSVVKFIFYSQTHNKHTKTCIEDFFKKGKSKTFSCIISLTEVPFSKAVNLYDVFSSTDQTAAVLSSFQVRREVSKQNLYFASLSWTKTQDP